MAGLIGLIGQSQGDDRPMQVVEIAMRCSGNSMWLASSLTVQAYAQDSFIHICRQIASALHSRMGDMLGEAYAGLAEAKLHHMTTSGPASEDAETHQLSVSDLLYPAICTIGTLSLAVAPLIWAQTAVAVASFRSMLVAMAPVYCSP